MHLKSAVVHCHANLCHHDQTSTHFLADDESSDDDDDDDDEGSGGGAGESSACQLCDTDLQTFAGPLLLAHAFILWLQGHHAHVAEVNKQRAYVGVGVHWKQLQSLLAPHLISDAFETEHSS